jgi:hypothetical protein
MWTDEDLRFLRAQRVSVEEALTDATMDGYETSDAAWRAKYDRTVSYYQRELADARAELDIEMEDQRRRLMRLVFVAMSVAVVLGALLWWRW